MKGFTTAVLLIAALLTGCNGTDLLAAGSSGQSGDGTGDTNTDGGTPGATPTPGASAANCTYTQGYWKNHPDAWPVQSLTIGGTTYAKADALGLFGATQGDASLILGHQLIASMLNVANGAVAPAAVATALTGSDAWMSANKDADGILSYGISSVSAAYQPGVDLSVVLDDFNNGVTGPGHCSDPTNQDPGNPTGTGAGTAG